jgi:hypothetical protein
MATLDRVFGGGSCNQNATSVGKAKVRSGNSRFIFTEAVLELGHVHYLMKVLVDVAAAIRAPAWKCS